jgi:hypothetical protein
VGDVKVVDWITCDKSDHYETSFGGFGGFFDNGMRWKDYIDIWKDEVKPYAEALKKEIIEKNIRFGGEWHQYSGSGVPLFSDNTVATFSYRAWGDLLAAIWSDEENKDYSYVNFYMSGC